MNGNGEFTVMNEGAMKLLTRHYRALERVFAAEVNSALGHGSRLVKSKAQVFADLAREGYLEIVTESMSFKDGLPPMRFTGYVLTPAGHLTVCLWAAEQFDEQGRGGDEKEGKS